LLLTLNAAVITHGAVAPAFPLKLSEDRRHLVDQRGTPFLYHTDTSWMLFTKLTEAEAKDYIAPEATGLHRTSGAAHWLPRHDEFGGGTAVRRHAAGTGFRQPERKVLRTR
jgi:hypothetical protein